MDQPTTAQGFFDYLLASPVALAVMAVAVLLAVALLVAGGRVPRWLRSRRRLDDMFDAYRADMDLAALEAIAAERAKVVGS